MSVVRATLYTHTHTRTHKHKHTRCFSADRKLTVGVRMKGLSSIVFHQSCECVAKRWIIPAGDA